MQVDDRAGRAVGVIVRVLRRLDDERAGILARRQGVRERDRYRPQLARQDRRPGEAALVAPDGRADARDDLRLASPLGDGQHLPGQPGGTGSVATNGRATGLASKQGSSLSWSTSKPSDPLA
jgi:hypothetical protein